MPLGKVIVFFSFVSGEAAQLVAAIASAASPAATFFVIIGRSSSPVNLIG